MIKIKKVPNYDCPHCCGQGIVYSTRRDRENEFCTVAWEDECSCLTDEILVDGKNLVDILKELGYDPDK